MITLRKNITPYVFEFDSTKIVICVIGREIVRNNFYSKNGHLHQSLSEMANTLYKIKKKVPLIKNQPAWFTYIYIIDSESDWTIKVNYSGLLPGGVDKNKVKPFYLVCAGVRGFFLTDLGRSVFYFCYASKLDNKIKVNKNKEEYLLEVKNTVAHEAAHALDGRAAMKYYNRPLEDLSAIEGSEIYNFIKKRRYKLPF